MSDVAASGGYYIAMPAHAIVAEPATLTGSIGVFMVKFVIDGTLKKLGMNMEGVSQRASTPTCIRRCAPFTPEERAQGAGADAGDLRHVRREGGGRAQHDAGEDRRDRAGARLDRRGRRKEIGLVDELGGLERALAIAKQRAKIAAGQRSRAGRVPGRKSFYDIVSEPVRRRRTARRRSAALLGIRDARRAAGADGAAARLPPRRAAGADAERVRAAKRQVKAQG